LKGFEIEQEENLENSLENISNNENEEE